MNSFQSIVLLSITLLLSACQSSTQINDTSRDKDNLTTATVQKMDTAHKVDDFYKYDCVSFDLNLIFGGNEAFRGRVYTMTNSSAIRLDYTSGNKLLYTNGEIYTYADPIPTKKMRDRFALFTWQYFFMAPYKLADTGTNWKEMPPITIDNKEYQSQMLSFDQGIGDAPDDWYIMHPDPATNLLTHMGYIVTAGSTDIKKAESNAHAISYQDYKEVQGIPFSHNWIINDYTKGIGLGKEIGNATISNITLEEAGDLFDPKSDILYLKYE